MGIKNKHVKTLESVLSRISVLTFEIEERKTELSELAEHLAQFQFSLEVSVRDLAREHGIKAKPVL